MLVCKQCNHEQESGKFCGQCGGPLVEQTEESAEQQEAHASRNETAAAAADTVQTEQRNNVFQSYLAFITNLIKNPTRALQLNENYFGYGLISISIFALAYALTYYFLANKITKEMFGPLTTSLPFIDITVPLFFFIILFIAGAVVSIFVAVKLLNNPSSVKNVIAQFGGLLVPFMVINVAMILFGIAGMLKFTVGTTGLTLMFAVYFLPILLVFAKGTESKSEQRVYFSLGASALSMFISYIIIRLAFLDYLDKLEHIFRWL